MGLLGLLKPADSEPEVAVVAVHVDDTTGELHGVRVAAGPRVSTRRPIVAVVAKEVQLTRVVVTQDGQVEIITCVGSGRKPRVDTTAGINVALVCCTHVV